MGGRICGESPRDEKFDANAGCAGTAREYQIMPAGAKMDATLERHRSRQQLMACWPLGQHESWDIPECEIAAV